MESTESKPTGGSITENPKARLGAVVLIVALIAATCMFTGGDDTTESAPSDAFAGLSPVTDYVFQPATAPGPDPFGPSFANYTITVPTEDLSSGLVGSGSTGLYGGTGENACDIGKMIDFLMANPDRAAAWAGVQGITVAEIPDYLNSLTSAILMENTLVINHGYSGGMAVPFLAVLEAGTAVLVDADGIPRARCACGNPLGPVEEPPATTETTTTTVGGEVTTTTTVGGEVTTTTTSVTIFTECPTAEAPPYGFTQESDGKWTLHTPEGRFVWDPTVPGWHSLPDDGNVYATESDVPGYDVECWPCPPESNGGDTPSYDTDDDGDYISDERMLMAIGVDRASIYIVITASEGGSTSEVTVDGGLPAWGGGITIIDPDTTNDYEPEYDGQEGSFDGCFPPCPDDGTWGWETGLGKNGTVYVWVAPNGDRWTWNDGGWGNFDTESAITYPSFRDLPGWNDDCFECPEWGWSVTDGVWTWAGPDGIPWEFKNLIDLYDLGPGETIWVWRATITDHDDGEYVLDITELPGWDDQCHECPEWGWQQNDDGSWVWISPDGTVWGATETTDGWVWTFGTPTVTGGVLGVEHITDLPGYLEDCHDCPEWGFVQTKDGGWIWEGPDGNIWAPEKSGTWVPRNIDGDYVSPVRDYRELPGFVEDCHECPEWGWEQDKDGGWIWIAPNGDTWTPNASGEWSSPMGEDDTDGLPLDKWQYLPGYSEDCHDCPKWGWEQDEDGIWEWRGPDGSIWIDTGDGTWKSASTDVTYDHWSSLPGWSDDCNEGPPEETTVDPPGDTTTTTTTTTAAPQDSTTTTTTTTTAPAAYQPAVINNLDPSCNVLYITWRNLDPSVPAAWEILVTVDDLQTEPITKTKETASGTDMAWDFFPYEFYGDAWPPGGQFKVVVSRIDGAAAPLVSTPSNAFVGNLPTYCP